MAEGPIGTGALRRSAWIGFAIFAVFAALMIRILIIQTVSFEKYQSKVINQMTTESPVPANRGKIYDRNGNVLATNITTYRVFISPSGILSAQNNLEEGSTTQYAQTVSKGLAELLGGEKYGVKYEDVYKQATQYTQYLDRTIARKVDEETADAVRAFIEKHGLEDMVYLEAQSTRYYPGETLGAHVLGFTSNDGVGLYGLELQYNEYLKGVDGYYIKARDSYGNEMPYEYASYIEAVNGYNLTTTIDTTVQKYLEEQLEQAVIDSDAQNRACGIVMNVKTGAILAMATSSPFDLNDPWKLDDLSKQILQGSGYAADSQEYQDLQRDLLTQMWSNKAITESYIPGSTFKIITSSMALEEQVVSLTETCTCTGSLKEAGHRIHCHKVNGHGSLTFAEGLQQSCNVWFMTLGNRVGIENYQKYVRAFGYREKTGIDLPGEGNSIFTSEMSKLDLMIYAFGQNFNVTPIQQITAVSAVANGGTLMTPYLVEQITDDAGNIIYQHKQESKRQVVSEDVCKTISQMLEEGVSGNGGAKNAYVAGYRVAAKTGTSEKKDAGKEGKYICSTVAYAPADDPEIAIIIMVDEPSGSSPYGSTVAAPYVGATLKNVLKHLGVEQILTEKEQSALMTKVGSYKLWSPEKAKETIESRGLACEIIGEGEVVVSQYPASGTVILKETGKIVLCLGNEAPATVSVPNLVGMNAEAANQTLRYYGLNVSVSGPMNATVFSQSIAPGTAVPIGTAVEITFRSMDGDEEPNYDRAQ